MLQPAFDDCSIWAHCCRARVGESTVSWIANELGQLLEARPTDVTEFAVANKNWRNLLENYIYRVPTTLLQHAARARQKGTASWCRSAAVTRNGWD